MFKSVFETGVVEPGIDNYECLLRSIIADLEKVDGASANLTRLKLSLGARDAITGWRAKIYTEVTMKGVIRPRGQSIFQLGAGGIAKYENTGFIPDVIHEGDLVKDKNKSYYDVKNAPLQWWLNKFDGYYPCEFQKLANYPEESVTPPTPDEEDARYRTRVWLNMRLLFTADWASMYAFPNYPLQQEFIGDNAEEVLYCVGQPVSTPLFTYNHHVYAFREQVPITIAVLQKYNQSNTEKMLWAAEDALRTLCRDHPLGSLRTLDVIRDKTERLGSATICMRECVLNYKRSSDVIPTTPSITWGPIAGGPLSGTFIFPNVTRIEYPNGVPNVNLLPPGRVGNITHRMGDTSLVVKLTCDLDVVPWIPGGAQLTWKRPQTNPSKEDKVKFQVILDIKHNGAIDEPYQTLKLGWGANKGFKVTLEDFDVRQEGENNILEVTFQEYRATSASGLTVEERYGIT